MAFTCYQRFFVVPLHHAHTAWIVAALPLLLAVFCSGTEAAEWKMEGNINQSLSYDDNVIMAEDPEGSVIYRLIPTLNFARKTEVWDIESNASYGAQLYTDIDGQDQNPQNYELSTAYRTERGNLGLISNYSITPSRNIAEQDSGNFASNASRENWSVSPSYSYRLTELDSLTSSLSYSKSTYSTADFNDNENQSVNLGWQRQWSERINYSVSAFYAKFKSAGQASANANSDSYGLNLSANYLLSEQWQLNGTIGGRVTDTTMETEIMPGLTITDRNTSQGFLADLSAHYKGERLFSSFGLSRSLIPSGQGQLTEQTLISLDLSYQLSERLSSNMSTSYRQTDSVNDNNNNNGLSRTNLTLSPGLNWKLAQDWLVSASYQHRMQERKTPETITADSNLFMLTLNYNWPGLSISR